MTTELSLKPILSVSSALVAGLVGSGVAENLNLVIYYVAQGVNGSPLTVQGAPLSLTAVLLSGLGIVFGAGVIYWALARFVHASTRWLLFLVGFVLVLAELVAQVPAAGTEMWALKFI